MKMDRSLQDAIDESVGALDIYAYTPRMIRDDLPSFIRSTSASKIQVLILSEEPIDSDMKVYQSDLLENFLKEMKKRNYGFGLASITRRSPSYLDSIPQLKNMGTFGIENVFLLTLEIHQ